MRSRIFQFLIVFFFLFLVKSDVLSQFQRTIGGTSNAYTWCIKQTTDSGYALAGYTNSFGVMGNDLYIVKLDNTGGSIQWGRTVGGTSNDFALSMIQTTSGSYIVGGETESFGAGYFDIYVVMLDNNGTLQWSKTFGGTGNDYGESIKQTTDGGFAVAGYTNSFGSGDYDMYILKLDAGGSPQWMRTIGGTAYDYALSFTQTADGGYALLGATTSFGAGFIDFYIVKLDVSGMLQWSKTFGGSAGDYGAYIIQTSDGGYAAAGLTFSFGAGSYDLYIVKLDNSGALQWSRTIGGTGYENLYSIIQTYDGGYAISGATTTYGAGGIDAYIVKLDAGGNLQWNRTFGGQFNDEANSIIQTSDGGYAFSGSSGSFGTGDIDMYFVKTDASGNICGNTSSPSPNIGAGGTLESQVSLTTSPTPIVTFPTSSTGTGGSLTTVCLTGIQPISNEVPSQFSLSQNYPNPFNPSTNIRFKIKDSRLTTLRVYDVLGREITMLVNKELNPGIYEVEWNASNYPSGVYCYRISSGDFSETRKMILVK